MDLKKPLDSWSLAQWLDFIEQASPMHKIRLGLERMELMAQKLSLDHPACPVITVAGTNGKGSTVAALETIYHAAGYKVGSYTSPHLIHFNERIKINLSPIEDDALCALFHRIEEACATNELTYFERVTLAALLHFKQQEVDIIILEVGIGGRLDATNVIAADVALITTVDYDHQELLGDTLDAIGCEKAGILRPGRPLIYADTNPPKTVLAKAQQLNAPVYLYNIDYSCQEQGDYLWYYSEPEQQPVELKKPLINLKAAGAAIKACTLLQHRLYVAWPAIKDAMEAIFIPGRLQLVPFGNISILYDVSHNIQSAHLLAQTVRRLTSNNKVHAVFSALSDKDIVALIQTVRDCIDYWYLAQLDTIRAPSADYLLSMAGHAEIMANICYNSPLVAFKEALSQAAKGDLIVVFGSFYTVGQVMSSYSKPFAEKEII